jgi:hypothetical protein
MLFRRGARSRRTPPFAGRARTGWCGFPRIAQNIARQATDCALSGSEKRFRGAAGKRIVRDIRAFFSNDLSVFAGHSPLEDPGERSAIAGVLLKPVVMAAAARQRPRR